MKQKIKQRPPALATPAETPFEALKKNGWCLLSVALFGFAVYFNSLHGVFLWDDETLVQRNPFIQKGFTV